MEQIQDESILIARNNETGEVGAVIGQNPDGTPKMTDAKSAKLSDLVKFSKGQNPLEAFMSNFLRQAKNPTLFGLFKVPAENYEALSTPMVDLLQDPEANKDLLDKYKVDTSAPVQQVENAVEQKPEVKNGPIDADSLDWNKIQSEWGVSRQQLEESGALKQMLYNHKSPGLVKVAPVIAGERMELEARLSFKHNPDGSVTLSPHFVKTKPELDIPFKGYTFSESDKAELRKNGNLGKVVDLTDPLTGEVKKSLVSIDRLTNEIESVPVDKVFIKQKVANVELSMKEIGILKAGGVIRGKDVELPNGSKFTADIQYSAAKRDVEFNSEPYRKRQEQTHTQEAGGERQKHGNWLDENGDPKRLKQWCGIPLNQQQQDDYLAGKKVEVGMGKDRYGNDCTIYFQFDPKEKRPETTRVYPDRDKVVGVAEESKTQYAVNNEGKTHEATKGVKEPLQKGQTAPKNEAQEKEQKRSRGKKIS